MSEQEDTVEEVPDSEETEDKTASESKTKPMLWLRPLTGLFSVVTALMYFFAACIFIVYRMSFQYYANLSNEDRSEKIRLLEERGQSSEEATKAVDLAIALGEKAAGEAGNPTK